MNICPHIAPGPVQAFCLICNHWVPPFDVAPAAAMYGGYGTAQGSLPLDPLSQPLPVAAPATWADRERRVEWCLRNLTRGEKALLYRLLHDTERLRLDQCAALERAERAALDAATRAGARC